MDNLSGQEVFFNFNEMFFSRTNRAGVIESGNSVFQRVSGFEWKEILGKPHKIVRHPQMPSGVFYILWDYLLSGRPVGAYVLNRTKSGSYYWVLAFAVPNESDFISIRIRPSTDMFKIIKGVYAKQRSIELSKKISPLESSQMILETIRASGFNNYDHFMSEILTQELDAKKFEAGESPSQMIEQLRQTLLTGQKFYKNCEDIFSTYKSNRFVSLNLEIQGEKLGNEGSTISIVSSKYHELALEIRAAADRFLSEAKQIQKIIQDCQFEIGLSLLETEMYQKFKTEPVVEGSDSESEMAILQKLSSSGLIKSIEKVQQANQKFNQIMNLYEEVRKLMTGLEIVNLAGKIETAKLSQSNSELTELLKELNAFKNSLKKSLEEIDSLGRDLTFKTKNTESILIDSSNKGTPIK